MLDRKPFKIEIVEYSNGFVKKFVIGIWKIIKRYWKRYVW